MRIIPARAGFTTKNENESMVFPDHPRSRGVYGDRVSALIRDPGSSPLARGLPRRASLPLHSVRIIPARAGFTLRGPRSRLDVWDHPRSRGVYIDVKHRIAAESGSSPLARGLLKFAIATIV